MLKFETIATPPWSRLLSEPTKYNGPWRGRRRALECRNPLPVSFGQHHTTILSSIGNFQVWPLVTLSKGQATTRYVSL